MSGSLGRVDELLAGERVDDVSVTDAVDGVLGERAAANTAEQRTVSGGLMSSATREQVELDGATVTVTDCVRNDLSWVSADDPDVEVEAATGHRRPLTTTLEWDPGSDSWTVTGFEDPGIDGPMADVSVGLDYQLPDPEAVCVPPNVDVDGIEDAYANYWEVLYEASAPTGGGPADPTAAALTEIAGGAQLASWQTFFAAAAERGERIDAHYQLSPRVLAVVGNDERAVIADCQQWVTGGVEDSESGEPIESDGEIGEYSLDIIDFDLRSRKVLGTGIVETGVDVCDPASFWSAS